jgi:hypothetical protein
MKLRTEPSGAPSGFRDFLGVGAGDGAHRIEGDAEAEADRLRMAPKSNSSSISSA